MRTMLKFRMEVEAANKAARNGILKEVMDQTIKEIKPEATYFTLENGHRTGMMFFDLKDSSMLPVIAEPLFNRLNAELFITPVMTEKELAHGLDSWKKSTH